MNKTTIKLALAGLAAGVLVGWAGQAEALEGNTPYLPGISLGVPAGALPPPGFYGTDDNVVVTGPLKGSNNNSLPANVNAYLNIPTILWVPNFHLFGATYAASITQPWSIQSLTFQPGSVPGLTATSTTTSTGLFNFIFSPLNLSWQLNPTLFAKVGLTFYAPTGQIAHGTGIRADGSIGKVATAANTANDFWTFEPDFAISYLNQGLNLTLHTIFDFNTKDTDTDFQSGDVVYFDFTAVQTFGKWTVGPVANFTQQFTSDQVGSFTVPNSELQKLLIGPYVAYDFGPITVSAKYLFGVRAENTFNASFFHLTLSAPF